MSNLPIYDAWNADKDRIKQLEQQLAAKQAKIDELMLEYCPDEMTDEQLAEYARHQVQLSSEEQVTIGKELK
jgi:hypothetical protein